MTGSRIFRILIICQLNRNQTDVAAHFSTHSYVSPGMQGVRADKVRGGGLDLLEKIHELIERAEIVIADISTDSPNVYYEIGYARGKGKPPLLIMDLGRNDPVPVDLQGLEIITYVYNWDGPEPFIRKLNGHLKVRLNTSRALLKDMLIPTESDDLYVVVSPKYPKPDGPFAGQIRDLRTFGDYLGVMGLLTAFGNVTGESKNIQIVSGQYASGDLLTRPASLFMVGSRKSIPPVGDMMEQLLKDKEPYWEFSAVDNQPEDGDWPVQLYRTMNGIRENIKGETRKFGDKQIWGKDYGLIIRAPHPHHSKQLVLIMAGAHSLGTGAACIAATSSPFIKEIQNKLPENSLSDKSKSFWVLVKGTASEHDGLLDQEGVEIIEAGTFD